MGELAKNARTTRLWFWGLLALAVALRAWAFDPLAIHHPDETLQYLEPAYRLLTGHGVVTWEYRYGMRGWLLPWMLAGPMAAGQAIGGNSFSGIVAARLAGAMVGLIPVVAAWHIGRRSSPLHGIVAMAVMAIWYEQVYFSTHLLTESLSTALFLGGAALISRDEPRGRVILGGALLALAGVLRFHYGPAAAVLVLLELRGDWQRWRWLIAGALPVLAISGAVDVAMGQWPFQWVATNVQLNVIEGRSARFGIQPPAYFVVEIWHKWGLLAPVVAALAVLAGEKYRPLLFAGLITFAVHTMIAHKEYRFIQLSSATFILLAAIGSVRVARDAGVRFHRQMAGWGIAALLIAAWGGASLFLGRDDPLNYWIGARGKSPALIRAAGTDPRVCALGIISAHYWEASNAYLGRPMPIYGLRATFLPEPRLVPVGPEQRSFNAVVAPESSRPALPGYRVAKCVGTTNRECLFLRPGGCTPTPEADSLTLELMLAKLDI